MESPGKAVRVKQILSNKTNAILCPFPPEIKWTKQFKKQNNLKPSLSMPEHYDTFRTAARRIAEREQAILLSKGKPLKEIMDATEKLLKPLADSETIKEERILMSEEAKDMKKELQEMRSSGQISASQQVKKMIKISTTTIEFDTEAPPAYRVDQVAAN